MSIIRGFSAASAEEQQHRDRRQAFAQLPKDPLAQIQTVRDVLQRAAAAGVSTIEIHEAPGPAVDPVEVPPVAKQEPETIVAPKPVRRARLPEGATIDERITVLWEDLLCEAGMRGIAARHCYQPGCTFEGPISGSTCSCSCEGCARAGELLVQAQAEITGHE